MPGPGALTFPYRILPDGIALSIIGSALILASLWWNPRLWLQDFPRELREAVPPKTPEERRDSLVWGVPYLLMLFGTPVVSTLVLDRSAGGALPFGALFVNAFGILLFFNVVDLVLIDWLVVCRITPRFLVIPGTEGMRGYKDYGHHLRAFFTGTAAGAVWAALIAAVIAR